MTSLPLFDAAQPRELARVRSRIAGYVIDFWRERIGQKFVISELTAYVQERAGCAPASPDRILRDLRQKRLLNYEVLSRSRSEYLATERSL